MSRNAGANDNTGSRAHLTALIAIYALSVSEMELKGTTEEAFRGGDDAEVDSSNA